MKKKSTTPRTPRAYAPPVVMPPDTGLPSSPAVPMSGGLSPLRRKKVLGLGQSRKKKG